VRRRDRIVKVPLEPLQHIVRWLAHQTRPRVAHWGSSRLPSAGSLEAFPDARGTITNAFSSGDQVVPEVTWEGTQSGELESPQGPIPASNRRVVVRAIQVPTLDDGRIKENRHYFDMMGLLQQIGVG
jgi:predicted ester cyclase